VKKLFVLFAIAIGFGCSSTPELKRERVLSSKELEECQKIKEGFRTLNKHDELFVIHVQIAQLECELAFQEFKKAFEERSKR